MNTELVLMVEVLIINFPFVGAAYLLYDGEAQPGGICLMRAFFETLKQCFFGKIQFRAHIANAKAVTCNYYGYGFSGWRKADAVG